MKRHVVMAVLAALLGLSIAPAVAEEAARFETMAADAKWAPLSSFPAGAQISILRGHPAKPGLLLVLVKYPPNFHVPPHTHPSEFVGTVLSGTYYSGSGEKFDSTTLRKLVPGTVFNKPAGAPHFGETRAGGEVVVQFVGIAPSATHYMNPSHDPRSR